MGSVCLHRMVHAVEQAKDLAMMLMTLVLHVPSMEHVVDRIW